MERISVELEDKPPPTSRFPWIECILAGRQCATCATCGGANRLRHPSCKISAKQCEMSPSHTRTSRCTMGMVIFVYGEEMHRDGEGIRNLEESGL
jgi:hypothetical protein